MKFRDKIKFHEFACFSTSKTRQGSEMTTCHSVKNPKSWHSIKNRQLLFKVENILKAGLNSIPSPSPSVKIQIIGGKVCLRSGYDKVPIPLMVYSAFLLPSVCEGEAVLCNLP